MYNCVTITANGSITISKEHLSTCYSSHRFGGVILRAYGTQILLGGVEPTPEMVVREAFRVGGHVQMRLHCEAAPGGDPVRDPFYSDVLLPLIERYSIKAPPAAGTSQRRRPQGGINGQ